MDRAERRRRSARIKGRRLQDVIDYWGRKGDFGWDSDDNLIVKIKKAIIKKSSTQHPHAEDGRHRNDEFPYRREIKDARRGKADPKEWE